ncbi:MAG: peptide-methionine (S)-S-oxide reductase MsrA [Ostreibacterium sp.]
MNEPKQNTVFTATLAGGCFWCLEALFSRLKGISNLRSGFSGGQTNNPTYTAVCHGHTEHAEVIHFDYNPNVIDYVEILKIFFTSHNPTTLNCQGKDVGTQYRSAIFYHDDFQEMVAKEIIQFLETNKIWKNIVTEITPFTAFYPAGEEHNNYFDNHSENQYCQLVIAPKVDKFQTLFADKLN